MIYIYEDQDGRHEFTEQEILEKYYPYWSGEMKRIGKEKEISKEACLEDWIVVNWAWKKEEK